MKKLIDQWWALRENKVWKIRYDLIPLDQLKRLAIHYTNWWLIHWDRNWESWDENYRELCKQSAFRHFIQRISWETDEDHAMACVWNIFAYEHLKDKHLLTKQESEWQKKKKEI